MQFDISYPPKKSWNYRQPRYLSGHFLVSETELTDPNFTESIVFLSEHNRQGAFGFIINHKSEATLGELVPEFEDTDVVDMPVYVGGPVQQQFLFALHSGLPDGRTSDGAIEPVKGVFFEPDFGIVGDFLKNHYPNIPQADRPSFVLCAGYAGWAPGQLENELKRGSWIVLPATAGIIFSVNPQEEWRNALRRKGGIHWIAAETGQKPSIN